MANSRTDEVMYDFPRAHELRERDAAYCSSKVPERLIDTVTAQVLQDARNVIVTTPPREQKCEISVAIKLTEELLQLDSNTLRLLRIDVLGRVVAKLHSHGYFPTGLNGGKKTMEVIWTPPQLTAPQ